MSDQKQTSSFDVTALSKGILQIADVSFAGARKMAADNLQTLGTIANAASTLGIPGLFPSDDCGCCPPKNECPPSVILSIDRTAYAGERIKVLFNVKNKLNIVKTYKVGVRPLKDQNGSLPANQPVLNKATVTLQPGQVETVTMTIDMVSYLAGHVYETLIVLRELNVNQNIKFTLHVKSYEDIPEAVPRDEKKPIMRFQNWQSHFYCDPKPKIK